MVPQNAKWADLIEQCYGNKVKKVTRYTIKKEMNKWLVALAQKLGFATVKHECYPVENGEVSEQTTFTYHQNGKLLWAEYNGGDILKGSLIGTVLCKGELDFVYHHINKDMKIKTGKCHSVPTVLENGKIELSEQWQWTSGDYSKGESLLIEV